MSDDNNQTEVLIQIHNSLQELTTYIELVSAKLSGVEAGCEATAEAVDERENKNQLELQIKIGKELISHAFNEAARYTTAVIIGSYGAFFALWAGVRQHLDEKYLLYAAMLMTISVAVFVAFEVSNMIRISIPMWKGELPDAKSPEVWLWRLTVAVWAITGTTALASVVIMIWQYYLHLT